MKMNDLELLTALNAMENDAVVNQDTFITQNEELLRRYKAEPYGNEISGRSSVVSNDVFDTVESDMPALVRMFLGSGEVFKFKPKTGNETDIKEADEKTKYIDWIIRGQDDSYRINYGFLKDISLQKMGVLKYFYEETEKTEEHSFENLSPDEILEVGESFAAQGGEVDIEVLEKGELNEKGEMDLKFKVNVKREKIKIIGIPTESFLLSQNATSLEDAILVGDKVRRTRGELVAEGYKKDLVAKLSLVSADGSTNNNNLQQIRFEDEGGNVTYTADQYRMWANELVDLSDVYVMVDYDGDGIAERRHILHSGDTILENEAFPHVPYAMASGILTAHKAIGFSRAEVVCKVAEIKTALTRQMLDNGYMVNNPAMGVNKNVSLDDALSKQIGRVIRIKGDGIPSNNMTPIVTPFIGDKSLLLLQHMDQLKAKSVGDQLSSQGLNADQLNKETATRFNGVQDAASAKIELVARNIAEVGFRKLYEGVAWMVARYQTTECEFAVLGKALKTNPDLRFWERH